MMSATTKENAHHFVFKVKNRKLLNKSYSISWEKGYELNDYEKKENVDYVNCGWIDNAFNIESEKVKKK